MSNEKKAMATTAIASTPSTSATLTYGEALQTINRILGEYNCKLTINVSPVKGTQPKTFHVYAIPQTGTFSLRTTSSSTATLAEIDSEEQTARAILRSLDNANIPIAK